MSDELLRLAALVEGLSAPDRVVDTAIAKALGRAHTVFERAHSVLDPETGNWIAKDAYMAHEFTGSLDAAMTLVPEGWTDVRMHHHLMTDGSVRAYGEIEFELQNMLLTGEGRAATPALALCSAALKARAQTPPPTPERRG